MPSPVVNSALEVANWFFRQADADDICLEDSKLQHLLFLSQVHYALGHDMHYMFPASFVCNNNGFQEPNIAHILSLGMPFMSVPKFNDEISAFLKLIWQKYSPLSEQELMSQIKLSEAYKNNFLKNKNNIVEHENICQLFKNSLGKKNTSETTNTRKVLISQNGPVVVSQWKPRKLKSITIQE